MTISYEEYKEWSKEHGVELLPRNKCQGAVLVCTTNEGTFLAYCGGGGAWSEFLSRDDLDLETDPPELLRKHRHECPGKA